MVCDDSERLFCQDNVLKVNLTNQAAQRGAALLRQKGVFPAVPTYPEPKRPAAGQVVPFDFVIGLIGWLTNG